MGMDMSGEEAANQYECKEWDLPITREITNDSDIKHIYDSFIIVVFNQSY